MNDVTSLQLGQTSKFTPIILITDQRTSKFVIRSSAWLAFSCLELLDLLDPTQLHHTRPGVWKLRPVLTVNGPVPNGCISDQRRPLVERTRVYTGSTWAHLLLTHTPIDKRSWLLLTLRASEDRGSSISLLGTSQSGQFQWNPPVNCNF